MGKLLFREWLMTEGSQIGMSGDELTMMRACFAQGFELTPILAYADWLDERPELGDRHISIPRLTACMRLIMTGEKTRWCGDLKVLQSYAYRNWNDKWAMNTHHRNTIFFVQGDHQSQLSPTIAPGTIGYRLSLNNARWSSYTNPPQSMNPEDPPARRISVVIGNPTNGNQITYRDFKTVEVSEVPAQLIAWSFWEIIEWMTHRKR